MERSRLGRAITVVRGDEPRVRHEDATAGAVSIWALLWRCLVWGLLISAATGGLCGALLLLPEGLAFAMLGVGIGWAIGVYVGLVPTFVTTLAVAVVALTRHRPVRDVGRLYREVWATEAVSVAVLFVGSLVAFRVSDTVSGRGLLLAGVALLIPVGLIGLILRPATKSIVTAHARQYGWVSEAANADHKHLV